MKPDYEKIMRLDGDALKFDCETTLLEAYQMTLDVAGVKGGIIVWIDGEMLTIREPCEI